MPICPKCKRSVYNLQLHLKCGCIKNTAEESRVTRDDDLISHSSSFSGDDGGSSGGDGFSGGDFGGGGSSSDF